MNNIQQLLDASNNEIYLINDKYKIQFLKSGTLFDEFEKVSSCPAWSAFEYAKTINNNENVKIYLYEHDDIKTKNASLYFIDNVGKIKNSINIVSIKRIKNI